MDIQYRVSQTRGCHIVMPVFSPEVSDPFPDRRIADMNAFYTAMEKTVSTYAADLYKAFPHSRYICLGEALRDTNSTLTVLFRLYQRIPGQPGTTRIIRHIWKNGLLLRQLVEP